MNPLGSVSHPDDDTPVYVISVAAQWPVCTRGCQYDRLGIVSPPAPWVGTPLFRPEHRCPA